MKKLLFPLLLLLIASFAYSQKIINDANVEARTIGSFSGISVSSGIDLFLSAGNEAVAISASKPEHKERMKTEVKDGILKIWYEDKGFSISVNGDRRLKAYVSYKTLKSLQASGGSDVVVDGSIKSGDFTLVLSGGSDFKGAIDASSLTVKQSGGSDVNISGKVTNLVVDASGGSDFDGYDLITEVCDIEASGGSDIQITANKEITAKASGASDINYKGTPAVKEVKASGASSVKAKS
ncbi:MAG TPA: head GIN domain-containing protein [Flavisolibacter sp.]|jgi:hypothetical protein|nr:head GIN domain-containing protein [Flavisolibacter sp.]